VVGRVRQPPMRGFRFRTRLSDCQHLSIVPSGTDTL
jgi:hypothetical protein